MNDFYDNISFEYDEAKSKTNHDKHGIDFEAAKALWCDPEFVEVPARTMDEPRYVVIGKIGHKHWSAVVTYRSGRIRIISVRRSRTEEVAIYESEGLR